jgi:hypothetical protein
VNGPLPSSCGTSRMPVRCAIEGAPVCDRICQLKGRVSQQASSGGFVMMSGRNCSE